MDLFSIILGCVIIFILLSICGWCCKRKREGHVYGFSPPFTTVTTTHAMSASPVIAPPYPVEPHHPVPVPAPMPSSLGFTQHVTPYPHPAQSVAPYPTQPPHPSGLPPMMPTGTIPPYPTSAPQPPSYLEATMQTPPPPALVTEGYAKQAPYNPNY